MTIADRIQVPDFARLTRDKYKVLFSADFCFQVGLILLATPVVLTFCVQMFFHVGGQLSALWAIAFLSISIASSILCSYAVFRRKQFDAALLALILFVIAALLASLIHDSSIDGQHYHFQAIHALANGWNPYLDDNIPLATADEAAPWVFFYPKGGWIFSAALYSAGAPLAFIKPLGILILLASLFVAAGTLLTLGLTPFQAWALGAVAAFNPVALAQLFTVMNDGLLAGSLLIFICGAALWILHRAWRGLCLSGFALAFAIGLKFSALPVFFILTVPLLIETLAVAKGRNFVLASTALGGAALLSVLCLNWNPYVTNFQKYGHPFHPLMGRHPVDIMTGNRPPAIERLSPGRRFLYSLFAETSGGYDRDPDLKVPFVVSRAEFRNAGGVDTRIAGFGPFFSAAILVAGIGVFFLIVKLNRRHVPVQVILIFAMIAASIALMPENWWARYVPQLWLLPVGVAVLLARVRERTATFVGSALTLILALDAMIVGGASTALAAQRSAEIERQIAELKGTSGLLCVSPGLAQSRIALLRERGIAVKAVGGAQSVGCTDPKSIAAYGPDRIGGAICPC